jgi:hypothetical protein
LDCRDDERAQHSHRTEKEPGYSPGEWTPADLCPENMGAHGAIEPPHYQINGNNYLTHLIRQTIDFQEFLSLLSIS